MKFLRFEDMKIWQESKILANDVYTAFSTCRDFSFKNQIERAAVSIMNNVAEGYERGTTNSFINYLLIAKGSSGEVRSMLYLAILRKYITDQDFNRLYNRAVEISRMIAGFVKQLEIDK